MADADISHFTFELPNGNANRMPFAVGSGPLTGVLKALPGNSGPVYLGDSTVTVGTTGTSTDGFPLAPGDQVNLSEMGSLLELYVRGTANDAVAFLGSSA
jgi:hypothetical protein